MSNSILAAGLGTSRTVAGQQALAFDPQYNLGRVLPADSSAGRTDTAGLVQVAEQFETLFLQMVLKNMRAASDALGSDDGMFSSEQQLMFRDLYDTQMAQSMAHNSKTGLAEQIVRQFGGQTTAEAEKLKFSADPVAPSSYQLLDQVFGGAAFNQPLQTPRVTPVSTSTDNTGSE